MNCKFPGCKLRATKYMLNKVRVTPGFPFAVNNARAHAYCEVHWDRVYRRYWL